MKKTIITIIAGFTMLQAPLAHANDLDDKIGKYTDDDINVDHQLGDVKTNTKFKMMEAESKAKTREQNADQTANKEGSASSGGNNMNSVVIGAGSRVRCDIIIIDKSRGDKFNIGK